MNSYFKQSIPTLNSTTIYIIIAAIIFIIIAVYFYYYTGSKPKYKSNNEGKTDDNSSSNKQAELLFFYADWCPHCKTAKPIWNDLKSEYQNKTINGYHIIFTEINCANESAETEKMMDKYSVEGFPTIKLIKDGQVIEYDAKPSKDTLVQFLNTTL
jgi:thiol-disulfide isomerase/thioredoxin